MEPGIKSPSFARYLRDVCKNMRQHACCLNTTTTGARARKQDFSYIYGIGRQGRPTLYEGGPCARARARALSTRGFHQNSHFLFCNFQNNQSKTCSAPRVWQLCKSSAQSEPISKSYDQNKKFKNLQKILKTKTWTFPCSQALPNWVI